MKKTGYVFALAIAIGGLIYSTNARAITNCMSINMPGSYVLENNLPGTDGLLPNGNCLQIQGGIEVTINLAGFVITGNGRSGVGVNTGVGPPSPRPVGAAAGNSELRCATGLSKTSVWE